MRVGKLSHLMPSVSAEVTGSEQWCTAGVSLDKVREGKKSGRGKQRKWRRTVWSHWGETTGRDGYYLSLLRLTEKTSTGDKKMDGWHMLAFWVIKQKAKTLLLWLFIEVQVLQVLLERARVVCCNCMRTMLIRVQSHTIYNTHTLPFSVRLKQKVKALRHLQCVTHMQRRQQTDATCQHDI